MGRKRSTALRQQFASLVRERMAALNLNQADVADRLGVSQPYVTKLLAGQQSVGLDVVEKVARALGCEPVLDFSLQTLTNRL